jgi:endonuclease/exonuclease/phosphatase family metal-dependent hydrolase
MKDSSFMNKAWKLILGSIALVASISGMLSLLAQYTDPQIVNHVHLFGLLFPVFFLSHLILFLVLLLQRTWLALLPLVMIILSWSTIAAFVPLNPVSEEKPELKVLTYNLHLFYGQGRKSNPSETARLIASSIRQSNSDVVFIQEFSSWSGSPDKDLADFIEMCGMDYYQFDPYWAKGNRNKEGMLVLSHFPAENSQSLRHSNGRLISQFLRVTMPGNKKLQLVNVHLVSFGLASKEIDLVGEGNITDREQFKTYGKTLIGKLNNSFKKRSVEVNMILEKMEGMDNSNLILAGDFNDTPASFTYRQLINSGLKDSHSESGRGFISTYAGQLPFLRIDYIYVSNDIITTGAGKLPVVYSDHYPYYTELVLGN